MVARYPAGFQRSCVRRDMIGVRSSRTEAIEAGTVGGVAEECDAVCPRAFALAVGRGRIATHLAQANFNSLTRKNI